MLFRNVVCCAVGCLALLGCNLVSQKTPKCHPKPPAVYRSLQAANAAQYFWTSFHSANYAESDNALAGLSQALAADPSDHQLLELNGLCGAWKLLEHGRTGVPSSHLASLGRQSLSQVEQAGRLDPSNRLTPGFISSIKYQVAAIEQNASLMQDAYCELQHNTEVYPQFHGFVEGWVLTAMLPPTHPGFESAVEAYYKTLDSCAGIRVPRKFPRIGPIAISFLAKKTVNETVCYDTHVAPHNLEGTLLGLGDALLKQGKKRQAKIIYEDIRRVPNYVNWPFKDALELRLSHMDELHCKFEADSGLVDVAEPAMLFQSTMACTCCHATLSQNQCATMCDNGSSPRR